MRLKDTIAIVLGASAERGTGWAVAERFAAEGAKVLVGARREGPLQALAKRNLQVNGGNHLTRFPSTAERPSLTGADPTSGK
jgi:NAD(P)-dependent dehydrogenase (short-subunit alcohol dehydrogenase family)